MTSINAGFSIFSKHEILREELSINHDQTNGLKTNLFLNRYNYCVVEHE